MPNRIIKESINESRGLTSCSFFAQDLYKRLITYADDYGRFNADPQIMIARLYPRELSVINQDDLIDGLIELVGIGKIGFYTAQPRHEVYGAFPNWNEHQRLRESKKKAPDPTDTSVNDWYFRRFISLDMKAAIIERDGFKCRICGKHIAESMDAMRVAKMGTGLFHIDHIVPCNQGGRATMENLQLTCPTCNLSRKRRFTFEEILKFADTCGEPRQVAETCEKSRPESESESNTNPNPITNTNSTATADAPPEKAKRFSKPSPDDIRVYCADKGISNVDPEAFCDHYESNGWRIGGRTPMKDWQAAVRNWSRNSFSAPGRTQERKHVTAHYSGQRQYTEEELNSFISPLLADALEEVKKEGAS